MSPSRSRSWVPALAGWAVLVAVLAAWQPLRAGDAWFHLAGGREIAQHGFPWADSWSWTAAGTPLQLTGWLSDLVMYEIWRLGGLGAVTALGPLSVLTVGLGVRWCAIRLGARAELGWAAGAVAAMVSVVGADARPQLVTYAVTAPYLYLALQAGRSDQWRARAGYLGAVFVLGAVWVNLHTGGLSGPLLAGAAMVGLALDCRVRRAPVPWLAMGLVVTSAGVATLCSPYGATMWTHARLVRAQSAVITEWQHAWQSWTYASALIAPFVILTAWSCVRAVRRRDGFMVVVPALVWSVLSVDAVRHSLQLTVLAVLAAAVVGTQPRPSAPAIDGTIDEATPGRETPEALPEPAAAGLAHWRGPFRLGVVVFLTLASIQVMPWPGRWSARTRPGAGVMAGVDELPAGCRLLNDMLTGNAVVWARPELLVSADGRNDMYGAQQLVRQYRWLYAPDPRPGLRAVHRLQVSCVLARREPPSTGPVPPLVDALVTQGWHPIGAGDQVGAVAPQLAPQARGTTTP